MEVPDESICRSSWESRTYPPSDPGTAREKVVGIPGMGNS